MVSPKRKLWEFQGFTVCRVLGLSFDGEELGRIFRILQLDNTQQPLMEAEMHGKLVTTCRESNRVSKYVDKMLSQQFEPYQRRVEGLSQEDICGLIEQGEVFEDVPLEALIWFAARHQHERIDEIETRVFNAVHIREHQALRFYDALSRALPDGKAENVMQELKEAQKSREEFRKRYQRSEGKKEQLRSEIEALKRDSSRIALALTEQKQLNEKLKGDLEKLGGEQPLEQTGVLRNEVEFLRREIKTLSEELLKRELYGVPVRVNESKSSPPFSYKGREGQICPQDMEGCPLASGTREEKPDISPSLNGTRVAFVGGLDTLVPYYRQAVECLGGVFCDHCAICSQGRREIERLVDKADVVFCPMDINSHTACRCTRKACKHRNKPCCFLRGSSLSMLRKELVEFARNNKVG